MSEGYVTRRHRGNWFLRTRSGRKGHAFQYWKVDLVFSKSIPQIKSLFRYSNAFEGIEMLNSDMDGIVAAANGRRLKLQPIASDPDRWDSPDNPGIYRGQSGDDPNPWFHRVPFNRVAAQAWCDGVVARCNFESCTNKPLTNGQLSWLNSRFADSINAFMMDEHKKFNGMAEDSVIIDLVHTAQAKMLERLGASVSKARSDLLAMMQDIATKEEEVELKQSTSKFHPDGLYIGKVTPV